MHAPARRSVPPDTSSCEQEWRLLMLAMGAPAILIFMALYALGIPESPRWLLLMKRRAECVEVPSSSDVL